MDAQLLSSLIENCAFLKYGNLTLFYTDEVSLEDLRFNLWRNYVESYIIANNRLLMILSDSTSTIEDIAEAKFANVLVTTDKEVFKKLLEESEMNWVSDDELKNQFGYVYNDIYVYFINPEILKNSLPRSSGYIDGSAHEFTHGLLYQYLEVSKDSLQNYYDSVFEEGIAVLLNNQYRYPYNMKRELKLNKELNFNEICIKNITEKGIMFMDTRFPAENFTYQYAAGIVKRVDDCIRDLEGYKSNTSLFGILKFIQKMIKGGRKDIYSDAKSELNIDILEIERLFREDLGLI